MMKRLLLLALLTTTPVLAHEGHDDRGGLSAGASSPDRPRAGRSWLAGDHHVHSRFSADYQADPTDPAKLPTPLLGKDGRYSIQKNAAEARAHGLDWMVTTDHGGPGHSKIAADLAYPELLAARQAEPGLILFYGMEFDTPGADHSSLILPRTAGEREQLRAIESGFSKKDAWPTDKARDTEPKMIEALTAMRAHATPPVVIANHPSRSATSPGGYALDTPAELRGWNDTAPDVAVGMEGAPGHQAGALKPDGSPDPTGSRGGYKKAPTMGGFDAMTATLGGFWDSMLAEGRRWWITATSDSHSNWRDGGNDFWPGEYAKTFVLATRDPADILDGIRHGRVFVTTGDLVSAVDVRARAGSASAGIGGTVAVKPGGALAVTIRVRDPGGANHGGRRPEVKRIDLITGPVSGPAADRSTDRNSGTRVVHRFSSTDWQRDGDWLTMTHTLRDVRSPIYLRVRGTNTDELEPSADPAGEDPWGDLWFYANPIFVTQRG